MFILVDCDNFFVSCERIFQPHLKKRPLVVLSNNDGCVVSRSNEAKKALIPMCAPFFKIAQDFKAIGGIALSSNYELYADISNRLMTFLRQHFQEIEPYSIDEAFIKIPYQDNFLATAAHLRSAILQQIGIPVSIAVAPSKTLCKIASNLAKKGPKIYELTSPNHITSILDKTEIGEIWGIGKSTADKLKFYGIFTASDLIKAPLAMLRKSFGINIEKTIRELQGHACIEFEDHSSVKTIISSGSFEHEINTFEQLEQNLSEFVDCACQRLRAQHSVAGAMIVQIFSNRFNHTHPQYNNSAFVGMKQPTANTACFMHGLKQGLQQIYRNDCWYKRAGVILSGIENQTLQQPDLLTDTQQQKKDEKLMQMFDNINQKFGRRSIFFAIQAQKAKSYLKREFKSPNFTTSWLDLPKVN